MGQGSFSCSRDSVWSASLHEIRIDHETLFNIIMIVVCFLWNNHKMATACKKSSLCKNVQPVAHSARRKGLRTADGPGPGTRWRCWQVWTLLQLLDLHSQSVRGWHNVCKVVHCLWLVTAALELMQMFHAHSYSWGPQGLPRLYTICIQQQPTFTSQPSTVPTTVSWYVGRI